jgi:hypothetical protein
MKVSFDRTIDHLVHFNQYHCQHSPGLRRMYRLGFIGAPIAGFLAALVVGFMGEPILAVFAFVSAAALYAAFLVWYSRWSLRWTVRKLLSEGHNKGQLGPHEIEIGPDGLREQTAHDESKQSWATVERVVEDDSYIFNLHSTGRRPRYSEGRVRQA